MASAKSLLTHPPELQLEIFGHIAADVPTHAPIADYIGLYLSCQKFKAEFEAEYIKLHNNWIKSELTPTLSPNMAILPAATFTDTQHLRLAQTHPGRPEKAVKYFFELFKYHVTSLTVYISDESALLAWIDWAAALWCKLSDDSTEINHNIKRVAIKNVAHRSRDMSASVQTDATLKKCVKWQWLTENPPPGWEYRHTRNDDGEDNEWIRMN